MDDASLKKSSLFVATLTSFLTPFMGSSVNIALPSIGRSFSLDALLLSWIATGFLLSAAMFLVPLGRIADIYGRKRVFLIGTIVYTLSALFSGLAPTASALIAFRVLQGVGAAMIFGTSLAIITSVFPPGERGRALGIAVGAVYAGLSLGPFVGGFLTEHFGWRSVFYTHVPLGVAIIVVTAWKLKGEWAGAKGEKFDLFGSIIYSLSLVALMYGVSILPQLTGLWLALSGLGGVVLFAIWESRISSPVLEVSLFRNNRVFAYSSLAALINYSATFAVTFLLSLYLQYIKGLSPQNAGLVLICQPVIMTLLSPIAGRLSDRIQPRLVASAGMSLTAIGLLLLTFLSLETTLSFVIAVMVILGFGFALFSSPNTNAVMSSVEKKHYGVASATVATMRLSGQMISMAIAMLLFALYIGRVKIIPQVYPLFLQSVRVAFIIFAVLCVTGVFASLARGSVSRQMK